MSTKRCLLSFYRKVRPLWIQQSFDIFLARHYNTNYKREMDSNTETVGKKPGPLPRWQSFLSDLTPRLPPKPHYETVGERPCMSFGPQSISRIFLKNLLGHGDDSRLVRDHVNYKITNKLTLQGTQGAEDKLWKRTASGRDTHRGDGEHFEKHRRTMSSADTKAKSLNQPDDLSRSVSRWTLEMFSRYVDFEEHIEQLLIDTDRVDDQSGEMNKIVQETMDMFNASNTNPALENVLATEADVRIHLSTILRKMCPELGLTLRTESQIELSYLPTCKFDFLFLTRGGKPVGCMEAKTPSTMNSRAFAQAVVELLVLQQLAYQHDVDISTVPLFNVLSDGQRFVLMQVRGEKLRLEYVSKDGENVLKVRTTKVMEALSKLIKMTLNNIENPELQTS
ncbi:uncharacterized protein LOC121379083 [Gigantopelta aegis]|uniref:uncharacterized protein LOC121379083 n=1 Tax=Gigantopelta aegis TaxID=1735272 RepID=UPI001B88CF95|nr:uncharacterized protein LOC121379083 [Gigantopelta aegis]